jgi:Icc-related predicted phosphoesterase
VVFLMRNYVTKLVATAEPSGHREAVERLVKQVPETQAEALVVLGNLATKSATPRDYGQLFTALAQARLPTFYIPGPEDVPLVEYLREAAQMEMVYPHLHGVHGTFALAPGYVVFTGLGGIVSDDPHTQREEREILHYPAWEVAYRLKFLEELKDYQKVFLFSTPPEHKGFHERGSAVLAELIKSYNPRLVLVSGREQKQELLGVSLVVMPGSLAEENFSIIDLQHHTVEPRHL